MNLSIVIPARNEEAVLEKTIRKLDSFLEAKEITREILIINDASTDGTLSMAESLSKETARVRVLSSPLPHGFGLAIREGLDAAQGDAVAIFMADGSDAPEDLVSFWEAMDSLGVDCVFGSRFISGARVVDYPFPKLILNRLANTFIQVLFGIRYNDTTNAFKLYRRHVLAGVKPYLSQHFNLTVELPLKAIIRGYRWTVLPNQWMNRNGGVSKLRIKEMGSRYLFIVLYCLIEKWLSRGDYSAGPVHSHPIPLK